MFARFFFALNYAARNLRRNLRLTLFAVFCIAAGVATVVALRSLGLAIADSLVDNVRASNHGDITVEKSSASSNPFGSIARDAQTFTQAQIDSSTEWIEEVGGSFSAYTRVGNLQVTSVDGSSAGRPQFVSAFLIDPATFPPTEPIFAADPAGVPLAQLFTGEGNEIVISRNLADSQNIGVGGSVRVSNTEEIFIVRGIVPTETEASISNIFASFFGFAYIPLSEAATLQAPTLPNVISVTLPPGMEFRTATDALSARGVRGQFSLLPDLLSRNQVIGDILARFILVISLGALLIGGVGNINTMLVLVGRRTNEIAALKTFGLKGRQVAGLFLAEAFLLGILGSIVGAVGGLLLSVVVNRYGETFLQQRLLWRIYPEAILFGMGMGIIISLVFGILPVLIANKVRPAAILRPNEMQLPRAGCLQSLLLIVLLVVVIGGVAGRIIGDIPVFDRFGPVSGPVIGMISVAIVFVIFGIFTAFFWLIVWTVSKLPAWGSVDLRLALRNLRSRRLRTAFTLLALTAGMFALSSITFIGVGTREALQFQVTQQLGGNVLVFPVAGILNEGLGQGLLNLQLGSQPGVLTNTRLSTYNAFIAEVNGQAVQASLPFDVGDNLPPRAQRAFSATVLQARDITGETPPQAALIAGRYLTPEDRGQRVVTVSQGFANGTGYVVVNDDGTLGEAMPPVNVGEIIAFEVNGDETDFTVVGITADSGTASLGLSSAGSSFFVPPDSVPGNPIFTFNILNVTGERLNDVLLNLSTNPLILSLDISYIDGLLRRLIDQFSAIPTLVGLLSLLAAAVTMANTISLAVLERRRSIGVLKAVGLKGRRVLWILLLENVIIGALGGFIGVGLSALITGSLTALSGFSLPIPAQATPVAVGLIVASVGIAVGATLLSAAPATRENVANVLRYE